jgi:hypothetical protein
MTIMLICLLFEPLTSEYENHLSFSTSVHPCDCFKAETDNSHDTNLEEGRSYWPK